MCLWKRLVSSFGGSARRIQYFFFFFLVLGILNFKYYLKKNILTRNVFIINTFYSPFSVPYFEKKITMMIKNWLFSQRN